MRTRGFVLLACLLSVRIFPMSGTSVRNLIVVVFVGCGVRACADLHHAGLRQGEALSAPQTQVCCIATMCEAATTTVLVGRDVGRGARVDR